MRPRVLLALSIALNLALALMVVRQGRYVSRNSVDYRHRFIRSLPNATGGKTNVVVRRQHFQWSDVESDDYEVYIANLKSIGCPLDTIRDIIVADVNQMFAKRRVTEVVGNDHQWWRSEPDMSVLETAANQAAALDVERRTLLTQLLGPNWEANNTAPERDPGRMNGPVLGKASPEVKMAVAQIERDSAKRLDAYADAQQAAGKPLDPMEIARLRMVTRNELAKVLTPEQYEEYLLRYSQNAETMRAELKGFGATQEEFRAIFRARDQADAQIAAFYGGNDKITAARKKELEQARDNALQQALGDRYPFYKLTQDPVFREAQASAEQIGAPPEKVLPVYQINRLTAQEKARVQADAQLTPEQREAALKTIELQQQNSLRQVLGDETYGRLNPAQ